MRDADQSGAAQSVQPSLLRQEKIDIADGIFFYKNIKPGRNLQFVCPVDIAAVDRDAPGNTGSRTENMGYGFFKGVINLFCSLIFHNIHLYLYKPFCDSGFILNGKPEKFQAFPVINLLSLILKQKIRILKVIPNDSSRLADESSLVIMEIVVELADRSIANVEMQKICYMFPGQRAACYSADLLLRQYKRVRGEKGKQFSYRDIKKVYTIIFYDESPGEFHQFPDIYIHRSAQKTDTGLKINLLQEYVFLPLDNYREILHNKGIRNQLEAWLAFLSVDEPEIIVKLVGEYPQFKEYYEEIYRLCMNTEKVMNMFSKELQELDRNTVQYMIDEMQNEIDKLKVVRDIVWAEKEAAMAEKEAVTAEKEAAIAEKNRALATIAAQQKEIEELKARLAENGQ